ncbi:MAG: tRNA uridine-5-carboxymethylaminomethyl(34) synthesis GTPase MnmE, partial [bacterium]
MRYDFSDTIVAPATGAGKGAISIVRVSGKDAIPIAESVFIGKKRVSEFKSHTAHMGYIVNGTVKFEKVLLLLFRAPNSYTGEDIIEFHLHGGRLATEWLIEILVNRGARLAEPGEFTFRALINGKIDLIQAESINELVNAKTKAALVSSLERLDGKLSEKFKELRSSLWGLLVEIEAYLNFPEEGLECDAKSINEKLLNLRDEFELLCENYDRSRPSIEGARVVIVGPKNAGKSSLFNALLGEARSIVSPIPGTTRDFIDAQVEIDGKCFTITDTAGIGKPKDEIDAEGQKRTESAIKNADIIIYIIDGSIEPELDEFRIKENTIIVANKVDLGVHPKTIELVKKHNGYYISALKRTGIDNLVHAVTKRIELVEPDKPILGNERQRLLVSEIVKSIDKAQELFNGYEELCAEELKNCI